MAIENAGSHEVILIPGMNCDDSLWVGCDFEGGQVTTFIPDKQSIELNVDALAALVNKRAVFVGLSLGAIIAMAFSRLHPEKVAGLLLMSTNPNAPTSGQQALWANTVDDLRASTTSPMEYQKDIVGLLLSSASAKNDTLVKSAIETAKTISVPVFENQLRTQQSRVNELVHLSQLQVPVEILCGDDDKLCPVERHVEIRSVVSNSHLEVVKDAGHLITLEAPHDVNAAFQRLISRIDT